MNNGHSNELHCDEEMWTSDTEDSYGVSYSMEVRDLFFQGMPIDLCDARLAHYYDIMNNDIRMRGNAVWKDKGYMCDFCDSGNSPGPNCKFNVFIVTPDEFKRLVDYRENIFCIHCLTFLWQCDDDIDKWEEFEKKIHKDFFETECVNNFHFTD